MNRSISISLATLSVLVAAFCNPLITRTSGAEGGLINVQPLSHNSLRLYQKMDDRQVEAIVNIVDILNESPNVFTAIENLTVGKGQHWATQAEFTTLRAPSDKKLDQKQAEAVAKNYVKYMGDKFHYADFFLEDGDVCAVGHFTKISLRILKDGNKEILLHGNGGCLALLVETRDDEPDRVTEARLFRFNDERGFVARFLSSGQIDRFAYCLYDKSATSQTIFKGRTSTSAPAPQRLARRVVLYDEVKGRTQIDLPEPVPYEEFGSFQAANFNQ